jgi:nucleoside-diphosphate-sugar epimerase
VVPPDPPPEIAPAARPTGGTPSRGVRGANGPPATEEDLEEALSRPPPGFTLPPGDILILGVGGKMGPTLARMAHRADPSRRIIGVARFSEPGLRDRLDQHGIETIEADLLDRAALARLPDAPNIVYMAGRKFGSTGAEHLTWAMNATVPAMVAERYATSRIAFFSTGCVYPFVPVLSGGATEATPLNPPPGDYAWSCVARERAFEHAAAHGTRTVAIRLNYAIDLRYGVLHDIAVKVRDNQPIDLAAGHVNVIWQSDANAWALAALALAKAPMAALNVTGPETISVRWLAHEFARRLGHDPILTGEEASTGWLNNAARAFGLFGYPTVPLATMIDWTADWVARGGRSLGKPTHYEVRDGTF